MFVVACGVVEARARAAGAAGLLRAAGRRPVQRRQARVVSTSRWPAWTVPWSRDSPTTSWCRAARDDRRVPAGRQRAEAAPPTRHQAEGCRTGCTIVPPVPIDFRTVRMPPWRDGPLLTC